MTDQSLGRASVDTGRAGSTSAMDRSDLLAQLARALAGTGTGEPLEERLCLAYLSILGGIGAALTLVCTGPERITMCATDEISARLEDLQDVLGEGPGSQAYQSGELVVTDLKTGEGRWPLFTDAARRMVGLALFLRAAGLPVWRDPRRLDDLPAQQTDP
jgi:hypothetical protein